MRITRTPRESSPRASGGACTAPGARGAPPRRGGGGRVDRHPPRGAPAPGAPPPPPAKKTPTPPPRRPPGRAGERWGPRPRLFVGSQSHALEPVLLEPERALPL